MEAGVHQKAMSAPSQFVFDFTRLSSSDIQLVTVITNAACIRYQLLGAPSPASKPTG